MLSGNETAFSELVQKYQNNVHDLLPFAALGVSAILVILLMGASKQFTANFQRPYSVDAKSEHTIEIVDTPVVLDIQSKPNLQNRVGGTNRSKNRKTG